ncbi:beta-sarcoglycan-like [Artemia franciscana]|uniref:beta-sarcoglycan-like n=1 Tax=Artemia franciscana TaxID=6661 RepID=UPI0032DAE03E
MDEEQSLKAKGPPGYCFWAAIFALTVLIFSNFFMTVTLYKVLYLTTGMESIEVDPEHVMTTFTGDITLDSVLKLDGKLETFSDENLCLVGEEDVYIKVPSSSDNTFNSDATVNVGMEEITLKDFDRFDVVDESRKPIFSTRMPEFDLPKGVNKLNINSAISHRVASPVNSSLTIESNGNIRVKGNEGISIAAKEVSLTADEDIRLHSINGSIILSGSQGIILDVNKLSSNMRYFDDPLSSESFEETANIPQPGPQLSQYKLCACIPGGKLFRVPIPVGNKDSSRSGQIGCHSVDLTFSRSNPCL